MRDLHPEMKRRESGLTVIEILVALALLAVVSTAIVGLFSMLSRTVRVSSEDVDMSRVVRTVGDAILDDWRIPAEWIGATVGGYTLSEFVTTETGGRCTGGWATPDIEDVRVVTINCGAADSPSRQTYVFEVGSPNL